MFSSKCFTSFILSTFNTKLTVEFFLMIHYSRKQNLNTQTVLGLNPDPTKNKLFLLQCNM